jgi:hypothetical protein
MSESVFAFAGMSVAPGFVSVKMAVSYWVVFEATIA